MDSTWSANFVHLERIPTSVKDFEFQYYEPDEDKMKTGCEIGESTFKKMQAHPNWKKLPAEYATLAKLQVKAEKLRQGSTNP